MRDNLLSAQVVTIDGRQIEASQKSNPDLFWAIRGGGGNFGVVTALEYQLHPVGDVLSGALTYPAGRIPDLLQAFTKFLAGAQDEMDAFAQLLPSEQGRRLKIDVCYCGEPRMGNDLVRPLRALKPQDDSVKVMFYLQAQAAGGFLQRPVAHFQTNLFLRELSGPAIAAITTAIDNAPATCKVIIVPLRGEASVVLPIGRADKLITRIPQLVDVHSLSKRLQVIARSLDPSYDLHLLCGNAPDARDVHWLKSRKSMIPITCCGSTRTSTLLRSRRDQVPMKAREQRGHAVLHERTACGLQLRHIREGQCNGREEHAPPAWDSRHVTGKPSIVPFLGKSSDNLLATTLTFHKTLSGPRANVELWNFEQPLRSSQGVPSNH